MSVNPMEMPESERPAWARPTPGEPRWHATALMLVVIALQLVLPGRGPLALPITMIELALLAAIVIINPRRLTHTGKLLRVLGFTLLGVASISNGVAIANLIQDILGGQASTHPPTLLLTGANVWITNVIIFAFWFWELDRGGPVARAVDPNPMPDFLFPQMTVDNELFREWEPRVIDYVYVSFTNATAFSPTDTMPLSRWAKVAMMAEEAVSLVTVALVVARAVNILT